jgi:DNA/RNA-binding domain of Phe-tRNA-synthetase-like protein
MQIILAPDLAPIVAPAVLLFDAVTVVEREARMDGPMAVTEARIRAGADLDAGVAGVRTMYKRLGLDPTKTRPSSEALLRRVRKGDTLPRINSLVDICNWCSVEVQIPYGLYDLDRIQGDVIQLRVGAPGEGYDGIRKDRVNVAGRMTLVDTAGPFGNPTSDSARTMVTVNTRRALYVIYCPRERALGACGGAMDLTSARMVDYAGARETSRLLL